MAATTTTGLGNPVATLAPARAQRIDRRMAWLWLPLLTFATLLINGYHPLAEDGGLYVAGVEYRLDPTLFPHGTAFVTAHLRYSLFAPVLAGLTRSTHLPLGWVLFLAYIVSLWLLLFAGLQLLRRCTADPRSQLGGVTLLAVWSTLPVAGTSLLLTDPYLTARSFSTPLTLLAIAYALDDWSRAKSREASRAGSRAGNLFNISSAWLCGAWLCGVCLLLAALLHPLMAFCVLPMVALLRLQRQPRPARLVAGFCALMLVGATLLQAGARPESPAAAAASLSRYYWFLSQWQWYERCGLAGPIVVLLLVWRYQRANRNVAALCGVTVLTGGLSIAIALLFAHVDSTTYLIARLQPLRTFLPAYALMALLLGACVVQLRPTRMVLPLFAAGILASGILLFAVQRSSFPASQPVELPWARPKNPWSQAFVWARDHTSKQALFALDPDYITTPGEDAQTFRATAQRSALPDFSKDGGEASITPALAALWQQSMAAQFAVQSGTALTSRAMLSRQTDAQRDARLRPLGVDWMLLHADAVTAHPCPYNNGTVKICRLQP